MQFATLPFLVFFLVLMGLAWLVRPLPKGRKLLLLLASLFFYGGWDTRLLGLLALRALIDWLAGEFLARSTTPAIRKMWLGVSLGTNLGMLGWFKYYSFFRDNIEALAAWTDTTSGLPVLEIVLPVGISYITFQGMSYTIDLYRGTGVRAQSLLDYLLFVAFFPKVLIGPIVRSRDLLPQLHAPVPEGIPNLSRAVGLVASGLFKKVVLATYLGTHLVEDAFNAPESFSSLELWVAAYAYTIEIYCDFSGYTDLAMGLALMLGYVIPDNFNQPYRSENIAEFWRRWHMTFSNWLRDYVFLPLGGSRGGYARTYLNLMIVMWVTGIWHGAAWKFVIWGSIHGVALVAYKIVQDVRKARGVGKGETEFSTGYRVLCWFYTFHLVVLARIFFRSTDVEVAVTYGTKLVEGSLLGRGLEWPLFPAIALGLALNFYGHHLRTAFERFHDRTPGVLRPAVWIAIGAAVLVLQPADVAPYIYFAF